MSRQGFRCSCFLTHNFFSDLLQGHFRFVNKESFLSDYGSQLKLTSDGSAFETSATCRVHVDDVIAELETELSRRKALSSESVKRKKVIREFYVPKHPSVYSFSESSLAPEFLKIVEKCRDGKDAEMVSNLETDSTYSFRKESSRYAPVFSFPVFSKEFCELLLKELSHFEKSPHPKGRPNTMNRRGVLLDELLGFDEDFVYVFRKQFVQPIVEKIVPGYTGVALDSQKAFTVSYHEGEDVELSYHYDNAEVTLNVCLGADFVDGELYFGDVKRWGGEDQSKQIQFDEISHHIGRGILHLGAHRHGALPIGDGERHNLILWFRASQLRNQLCPMCGEKPQLISVESGGDGFTV